MSETIYKAKEKFDEDELLDPEDSADRRARRLHVPGVLRARSRHRLAPT